MPVTVGIYKDLQGFTRITRIYPGITRDTGAVNQTKVSVKYYVQRCTGREPGKFCLCRLWQCNSVKGVCKCHIKIGRINSLG